MRERERERDADKADSDTEADTTDIISSIRKVISTCCTRSPTHV